MMNKWKITLDSEIEIIESELPRLNDKVTAAISIINGEELKGLFHLPFSPSLRVIVINPFIDHSVELIKNLLLTAYLPEDEVFISDDGRNWTSFAIGKIEEINKNTHLLYLPGRGVETSLEGFEEIIARLRAPNGCPWDRKQTHSSLRPYLLEETYEALDALDRGDLDSLKEELGDIMLQIVLHTQIASENGKFKMEDVLAGIYNKIVFRHPHVFKDWKVDGEQQVLQNWESLKAQERETNGGNEEKGLLDGVPLSYPALAQAQAIQERAARVGFDWKEIAPVLEKIQEEIEEIRTAASAAERASEFGDLLFALVNYIRWNKIDAESVLRQTNVKFRKRFAFIEKSAKATGKQLNRMTLEEMDELWEKAKQFDG